MSKQCVRFKMITPITELVENTKCLLKLSHFYGNTVVYRQNFAGDWTEMTTIKWPLVMVLLITCIWIAPYVYGFFIVWKGKC